MVEVDGRKLAVFRPERGEAIGRVGRVHAPRLPRELERRRADLGLPVPRLALRDGRQRHRRAGHAGARASRARRRGAPRNGLPAEATMASAVHKGQVCDAFAAGRGCTAGFEVDDACLASSRNEFKSSCGEPQDGGRRTWGDSPAPAMSLSKDRGTLRSSSRVLAVNRETGAGGPGGFSGPRDVSRERSRDVAIEFKSSCGEPRDGGRRTWGGFSGPRDVSLERPRDVAIEFKSSCGEPQDGGRRTWGGFSGPRHVSLARSRDVASTSVKRLRETTGRGPEDLGGILRPPHDRLAASAGRTRSESEQLAEARKAGAGGPGGISGPRFLLGAVRPELLSGGRGPAAR